jgi:hypothetical protein
MNAPIVTIEKIVLKNRVEAISCSAVWYWTARIKQIDAVGRARLCPIVIPLYPWHNLQAGLMNRGDEGRPA